MTLPLVSIITATYNHESFIGDCIQSVINQNYQNWEMIIIDDGSTDHTSAIISSFQDERIRYINQKNIGIWRLKETYNLALRKSVGEWIAVLEGDDCWPPDRLNKQLPILAETDAVLGYGRFNRIDPTGCLLNPKKNDDSGLSEIIAPLVILRGLLTGTLTIMPVTALIRRSALEEIGGFKQPPYYPAVEHPTWLHLSQKGSFLLTKQTMGYWRRHTSQASNILGHELSRGVFDCNIEFYNHLEETLRKQLGITLDDLYKRRIERIAASFFSQGRYQLIKKNKSAATKLFLRALKNGSARTKAKALIGLLSVFANINFETLIRMSRHAQYEK